MTHDDTLRLASAALGVPVTDPQPLAGSDRSVVLRCRTPDGTVVVKQYPDGSSAAFAREVAGLRALDHTPDLLAVDRRARARRHGRPRHRSDAGRPAARRRPVGRLGGCAGVGRGARATPSVGRGPAIGGFDASLGDLPADEPSAAARVGARRLLDDVLGLPADPALDAELDLIATLDRRDPASDVVSPTDTCPDNAVRTAHGWRFLDLEGATVHHAAYDAAYAAMPFSTCWCVFDPPPGFTDALLGRFTATLGTHLPDLVHGARVDAVRRPGVAAPGSSR